MDIEKLNSIKTKDELIEFLLELYSDAEGSLIEQTCYDIKDDLSDLKEFVNKVKDKLSNL